MSVNGHSVLVSGVKCGRVGCKNCLPSPPNKRWPLHTSDGVHAEFCSETCKARFVTEWFKIRKAVYHA